MVIDNITQTIINEPIREWERVLDHEDYPREYYQSFAAILVNLCAFTMPQWVTKPIMGFLATTLLRNFDEARIFLINDYVPEILKIVDSSKIPLSARIRTIFKIQGTLMKLIFAFLY